jgi:2-polyprenyl-3-methyl-5-hydroxy-6-metoxy-1,4-benzoquinol methylase
MNITQTFYDNLASQYDKLFFDWNSTTKEQALLLDKLFSNNGFDKNAKILDCACGIGTQSIGLAAIGYDVTASDISDAELSQAKERAAKNNVEIRFEHADFCALSETFSEKFDIIIAMDNALPHMLSTDELNSAIKSITDRLNKNGLFIASIRDYDALLESKPPYSAPYIHKTKNGQRVCFQTWDWNGDNYKLIQYIIEDDNSLKTSKFECEYRAVRREELSSTLISNGFCSAEWKFPEETGFYQPIVVAKK